MIYFVWIASLILVSLGSIFGFASAESYKNILIYSISFQVLAMLCIIYLWRKSLRVGRFFSVALFVISLGVIIQASVRLFNYL